MTDDACTCPKDDLDAQGRCEPCNRMVRAFMTGLLEFGLSQTGLSKAACRPCALGQMDGTLAEVMKEFEAAEPTPERRAAIAEIVGGFLITAPLPSSEKIRAVLLEWNTGFRSLS